MTAHNIPAGLMQLATVLKGEYISSFDSKILKQKS